MHPFSQPGRSRLAVALVLLLAFSPGRGAAPATPDTPAACPSSLGSPIGNFCVATPNVLWRGSRPDRYGAAWLMQQDVGTVVNLELLLDDRPAFREAQVADGKVHEAGYFRIRDKEPVPLLAPALADDHIAQFLAIVERQPKPVYVHCYSGENRTGLMVAAYRVLVEGVGAEQAIAEMGRYRGIWLEVDARYIRGLSPERRAKIRRQAREWIPRLQAEARIRCEKGACIVVER